MKHKRSLSLTLGIAGALLLLAVVGLVLAAPVTIDTFDQDALRQTAGPNAGDSDSGSVNSTEVLGGQREIYVYNATGGGDVSIAIDYGGTNQAKFNQDSGVQGWGRIVWDGTDGDGTVINTIGLGGEDLTDSGTNNGIQLLVYEGDGAFALGIYVYTGTTTTYYTLTFSADVVSPGQAFFVPFTNFTGPQSVFSDTGAIEFRIVPTLAAVDLTIDLFEATANTDWGDLPDTYSTTLSVNGARHTLSGTLYLGLQIDLEADGVPSVNADGDDNANFSDEDGIVRVPVDEGGAAWSDGATGYISATVTGGAGDLYAWFDWDNDGSFSDETPVSWTSLAVGEHKLSLTVDNGFDQNHLAARFRLVLAGASAPNYYGNVNGGEVEDYYWGESAWGPNAVTLSSLDAHSGVATPTAFALIAAALAGGAGLFVLSRRRKA